MKKVIKIANLGASKIIDYGIGKNKKNIPISIIENDKICNNYITEKKYCSYFDEQIYNIESNSNYYFRGCKDCLARNANINFYQDIKNFVVVTSYFNPQKSINRYNNFIKFRDYIINDLGIDLYVVEGYYYKDEPQLTQKDCPNLLTLEYYDILWQKERLLNILIESLPKHIDSFGWFDADIIFSCNNLKERCIEILKYFPVIQPWKNALFLSNDNKNIEKEFNSMSYYNYCRRNKTAHPITSHPGFAWCIRKNIWNNIYGLYDYNITGGGDTSMAIAFFNDLNVKFLDYERISCENRRYYLDWANNTANIIKGNVSFLDITIKHLYHGKHENRYYKDRWTKLTELGFNPYNHLVHDKNKPLMWNKKTPLNIIEYINNYLLKSRKEDDNRK